MYQKICIEKKIRNLAHQLEYVKRVYPRSDNVNKLRCKIYYYKKKLASLYD